jgi:hypothetical protein
MFEGGQCLANQGQVLVGQPGEELPSQVLLAADWLSIE